MALVLHLQLDIKSNLTKTHYKKESKQ